MSWPVQASSCGLTALLHVRLDAEPRLCPPLQRLHPAGLSPDWADKLHDQLFVSEHTQSTHEHYLQVRLGCFVGARWSAQWPSQARRWWVVADAETQDPTGRCWCGGLAGACQQL
jgi:hypothetical protein